MDRVVAAWRAAGLLVPNRHLKYAFTMFLVPKAVNHVRPILDLSPWTDSIITPHFTLNSASMAIRDIKPNCLLVKIDLKSGFHQLPLHARSHNHIGIFYRGCKRSCTRLPMGHALAPALFQRFAVAALGDVAAATGVTTVAYLNDWLLAHEDEWQLRLAVNMIRQMGITLNEEKSILEPSPQLVYLGFQIDSRHHTIKLTLTAHTRMIHLLRFTRRGSDKYRQRIAGYLSWILFNLRWPHFLAADVCRGDHTWMVAAMKDMSVLREIPLMDTPMTINLFTDATPHSIAAIIPSLGMSFAQALKRPEDINRAEAIAALVGLNWACEELVDTHITLNVDNASVFSTLRSGTGRLWRFYDLRRLHLSVLHALGTNPFRSSAELGEGQPGY